VLLFYMYQFDELIDYQHIVEREYHQNVQTIV
jgi:hypothetical protein